MRASLTRTDRDRVAVLTLDCPGRSMNVVDEDVLSRLADLWTAATDDDGVDAVVVASGKERGFGAGADVSWLPELAARDDAAAFLTGVHDLMVRMADGPKPVVTAVHGSALGGALELALAGHAIVAANDATLGLPEVRLDLLPGGGGTQLLLRWLPVEVAARALATGTSLDAAAAHDAGLVDEVVAPEHLLDAAVARARALAADTDAPTGASGAAGGTAPWPSFDHDATDRITAVREELAGSRRGLSPAAAMILDVLSTGVSSGRSAGLAAERDGFLALLRSPRARASIHLFEVRNDVNRRSASGDAAPVAALGVVGGGQMGAGIAATAVTHGLAAVVRDLDDDALGRARGVRDAVLDRAGDGPEDARAKLWSATTGWDGFAEVDAVIEAVFELPELKTDILATACGVVAPDTLLATNTSAISIAALADAVTGPERFIGMHFFSPVDRMPLVELIPHGGTSAATTQRAAALGRRLGKVPVVVGDAPGFYTSRVYARWLMEGVRLLHDGADVSQVDRVAKEVGFPVGPLQAHDEATLQLVLQASITQVADNVMADRLDVEGVRSTLQALVQAGVTGRRHGAGFHAYEDGRRAGANPVVADVIDASSDGPDDDAIADRLLLAFVTECLLCWDDGTLCHPDDGDVAAVLGIGFPRVLGGPFHWADEVGHDEVLARLQRLGPAFPVPERLGGGAYHDQPRRPAPFT